MYAKPDLSYVGSVLNIVLAAGSPDGDDGKEPAEGFVLNLDA